ncbi:MAG: MFS transporter [Candidatus Heimdallarchaeota archaeon]|nr:MFS transporter [Candidatus Heimdallarchaeota archaeon]MCK4877881.1 MFS transporter [Candidatus Heimdallarchaeota archaeon]
MKPDEESVLETQTTKKQTLFAKIIAVGSSGGQQLYYNYGILLAVGIGATTIQMSFITAIQNLGTTLLQGFFGRLSDKIGRRIVLILGFVIATITTIVISQLVSPLIFMIIIALYSVGLSMIIPTWNALQGDMSTEETRTRFISQLGMIATIASSVILLILGFLTDRLPSDLLKKYRTMILIGSFFFAISAIIVLLIKETNSKEKTKKKVSQFFPLKDKSFLVFLGSTTLWWFVMSFLWPIAPFIMDSVSPTTWQVAVYSAVFSAFIALGQLISGKFADKIGRKFTTALGFIILCFVPLILAFTNSWHIILIANIFGGIGNGFFMVALNSELLHISGSELRGTYTGTYNLFTGIVTFAGSFISGAIFGKMLEVYDFLFIMKVYMLIIAAARFLATIPLLVLSTKELRTSKN